MKIIDLKSAVIGRNICLRVVTDKGIDGYSQFESFKEFLAVNNEMYKQLIVGCDPTDVESVMRRLRPLGASKPWGKYVSSIEMALWDIAGKEAGVPAYKLLGGKVRDRVRVYCTRYDGLKLPHEEALLHYGLDPKIRAENILAIHEQAGFTIVKTPVGFHNHSFRALAEDVSAAYAYNSHPYDPPIHYAENGNGSLLSNRAMDDLVHYVRGIKEIVGDRVGLAYDCGPGMTVPDALRFARSVEDSNVLWLEDLVAGNYSTHTMAQAYRDITWNTITNIHTGEQIYLHQNYRELIENRAVNVVGPDPADCGGIAELKRIAEYANIHGILIAPHGVFNGVFGMCALMQVCCTLPNNYIAFEYPQADQPWWYEIVTGLPQDFFKDGFVKVWDKPGIGVEFDIPKAEKYLSTNYNDFFK